MKKEKRIIWTDFINVDDWTDNYRELCTENGEEFDEGDVYSWASEMNGYYLDDEKANLNVPAGGRIIAMADLGLWNGTVKGYKLLGDTASAIFDVFEQLNEYYVKNGDVYADCVHHDGTNRIMYRVLRPGKNYDAFLDAILNGEEITSQKLNYYTASLAPTVCGVYGW